MNIIDILTRHYKKIKDYISSNYQPKGSYANSSHTHDDRYYTESEIDNKLNEKLSLSGGTLTGRLILNEELHYVDTKRDWSDTSLDTWVSTIAWSDITGRRMHDLIGSSNGIWNKACYINENPYFNVNSNRNIDFFGETFSFNRKVINVIEGQGDNYIRYSSGLQIVFSMVPVVFAESNTVTTTVTLPLAFKDGNYQVVITNSGGNSDYVFDLSVITPTTTSFAVLCKNSVSISATRNVRYIAIGFWK